MLGKLISSSKTLNGVYRAIVIEGEKDMSSSTSSVTSTATSNQTETPTEESSSQAETPTEPSTENSSENSTETPSSETATPEQTPTPSIAEPMNTKCARVYIPALHRTQMPFKLGADGSIEGTIFDSSATSTVPPEPTTNETAGEVVETDTTVTSDTSNIYMKKNDYPIAQICSWSFCPELKMGDQTWVMFENGDAEFPVVIGSLGAVLPDIESIKASAAANSMFGGTYVGGTTGNPDADYIFIEAIKQGVSIAGGCGILANIEKESNFSVELNNGDGGLASGLCQWHPDRWANCETHCKDNNLDPKTIEGQTSFLISELKGYPDLWNLLCSAPQTEDGAYNCGYKFCFDFERPANKETKSVERGNLAKTKYFPIFGSGKIENGVYQSGATNITVDGNTTYYNGLIRCITGTDAGYSADEGLDISAPIGTPVYAPCNGIIRYSEYGHTPWGVSKWGSRHDDTPYSIGINMDTSVSYAGKNINYIFLTHLSKLVYNIPDGSGGRPVSTGELIAYSGTANNSPHLHIGLSNRNWDPLRNDEVRAFFNSAYGQKWEVGK